MYLTDIHPMVKTTGFLRNTLIKCDSIFYAIALNFISNPSTRAVFNNSFNNPVD